MWDRTGAGPTRAERGVAMGWPPAPRERIITREGALSYTSELRSLTVADAGGAAPG